jgi:hypothetical protein
VTRSRTDRAVVAIVVDWLTALFVIGIVGGIAWTLVELVIDAFRAL